MPGQEPTLRLVSVLAAAALLAVAPGCAWLFGGEDGGERTGRRRNGPGAPAREPPDAPARDFWLERSEPYLAPEERAAWDESPRERRFQQFGFRLLDIELRERLLAQYRDWLTPEEEEAYRTLRSYRDCRTFIEARVAPGARPGQAGDARDARDEHRPGE